MARPKKTENGNGNGNADKRTVSRRSKLLSMAERVRAKLMRLYLESDCANENLLMRAREITEHIRAFKSAGRGGLEPLINRLENAARARGFDVTPFTSQIREMTQSEGISESDFEAYVNGLAEEFKGKGHIV